MESEPIAFIDLQAQRERLNSRIDAAIQRVLDHGQFILGPEIDALEDHLAACAGVKEVDTCSVWAAYTVSHSDRDRLARELHAAAIPTRIYYPRALHQYTAYRERVLIGADLSVSEATCRRVLSLPMHPYLTAAQQERVIDAVRAAAKD